VNVCWLLWKCKKKRLVISFRVSKSSKIVDLRPKFILMGQPPLRGELSTLDLSLSTLNSIGRSNVRAHLVHLAARSLS
jgi:hypothetical protein